MAILLSSTFSLSSLSTPAKELEKQAVGEILKLLQKVRTLRARRNQSFCGNLKIFLTVCSSNSLASMRSNAAAKALALQNQPLSCHFQDAFYPQLINDISQAVNTVLR